MSTRPHTTCEQCGQTDDHPKVHIGAATKHNDCLSAADRELVAGSSPVAGEIIVACEDGKRGADLLAHIESLHTTTKGGK